MKKAYQLIILFVLYSLALGTRIYWLSQKNGLHVDEGSSIVIACYNDYAWMSQYEFNKEYSGKEVKEITLCDNDSLKSIAYDIYYLWKDTRDTPHTNLYYSFLRLSLAGLKTGDIKQIIFRGGMLNLFFFTISFVFFFLLMRLLFPGSKLLQFAAVFCAFLSTATISNTLFLRPYQVQETMFIVFCYFFFKTFGFNKKYMINDETLYINTRFILPLSLVTAFTLLTGYYAIIFIASFGIYVIFINYKKKNYSEIKFYIVALCLGFLFAQTFYSKYFKGYISGRTRGTASTLFGSFFENIQSSIIAAVAVFHKHFFTWPIIVVCALCLIYWVFLVSRKHKPLHLNLLQPPLYILLVSIFYFCIIMLIAPYKLLRYVMPVFPFFIILPVMALNHIGKKKLTIAAVLLLCAIFSKEALSQSNIENLHHDKPEKYYFSRDTDVPVFVSCKRIWRYADLVPYFNDKQTYYFINEYEDINSFQKNEFYLVFDKALERPGVELEQFKMEDEFLVGYFICRKYVY